MKAPTAFRPTTSSCASSQCPAAKRCGICSANCRRSSTKVEASNDPAFGTTGAKLRDAVASVERTSKWLLEKIATAPNDALAGATPYLRLFSTTLGGCMLANEALAARSNDAVQGDASRYVTLARFFAENVTVQSGALERAVIDSADCGQRRGCRADRLSLA